MSHMGIYSCKLIAYNKEMMVSAIKCLRDELGGTGLLSNVRVVTGYSSRQEQADLVFQYKGMNYPMGIRVRDNEVEFVGDPWKSENWTLVQEKLVEKYKLLAIKRVLQRRGLTPRIVSDTEKGIMLEGY